MEVIFKELDPNKDIKELAALASKIWNEYYPEVISQEQIDYMLKQSYSAESLRKQMLNPICNSISNCSSIFYHSCSYLT